MREAKSQPPKPSIQTSPRATGEGAGPADTDLGLWGAARAARRLLACGTMPRGRPKGSKDLKLRKRRGANKKPAAAASAGVTEEEEEETQEVHTTQADIDAMFGQARIVHAQVQRRRRRRRRRRRTDSTRQSEAAAATAVTASQRRPPRPPQ